MKCKRRFMHGKRRKRSPIRQEDKFATAPSNHPRFIGGSAPNPAKTALTLGKALYKGAKTALQKYTTQ